MVKRILLSAAVAARLGLTKPARATYMPQRRPTYVRTTGIILPSVDDYGMTADTIVDDPREPVIVPTGVLDERGKMLCRVTVPIKTRLGFHTPLRDQEPDEIHTIVPEDMLAVTDVTGTGISFLEPNEVGYEEIDVEFEEVED